MTNPPLPAKPREAPAKPRSEMLPLEHPLVPLAEEQTTKSWLGLEVAYQGRLYFPVTKTKLLCPHWNKLGEPIHHVSRSDAKACAERARDQLRAGKEIDW